jgi:hypothetical protein
MPLWIHCSQCDQHYQFPDAAAGKQASCPKCGKLLAVAAPAPPVPPVPSMPRVPQAVPSAPARVPPAPADNGEEPLWALPVPSQSGRPVADDDAQAAPPRAAEPPTEDLAATAGDDPTAYFHRACGGSTTFSQDVAGRISGDPFNLLPGTFCARCRRFVGLWAVTWQGTRETLAAYRARLRRQMHPGKILLRLVGGPLAGVLLGAGVGALANPGARMLGVLAGVLVGLPLGYFVTGIAFQIGWSLARRKKGSATSGSR